MWRSGYALVALVAMAGLAATAFAAADRPPLLAVPEVAAAPTVDGRNGPGEWAAAAVTCGFHDNQTGLPAKARVVLRACYDASALYVLYECLGEEAGKPQVAAGARDSAVWANPVAELFIAPAAWPRDKYAHFMVDASGTVADELCAGADNDLKWDPEWRHAVTLGGDGWVAEMAVPWASPGLGPPRAGARFRANFARHTGPPEEFPTWAPLAGMFHQPDRFGELVLAGRGPVAQVEALPGRATGPVEVEARLLDSPGGGRLGVVAASADGSAGLLNAPFPRGTGAPATAALPVEIGPGTTALVVRVADAAGVEVWRQTVRLDIPDYAARAAAARRRLAGDAAGLRKVLRRLEAAGRDARGAWEVTTEAAGLDGRLAALAKRAGQPLDADGLARLGEDLDAAGVSLAEVQVLIQAVAAQGQAGGPLGPVVTCPPATTKVQPEGSPVGPLAERLRLAMARGEYEPLQLVVWAAQHDLKGVRVRADELRGPSGARIPRERVAVNPIGFVRCDVVTPGAPLRGWVPDVLLPDKAMDVAMGRRQPFFVTVHTLAGDPPGEYRGRVRVEADGEAAVSLPLSVRVCNVTLPVKSHLRTAFVLWGGFRGFLADQTPAACLDAYLRYSKFLLAHRLSPITMWEPKPLPGGGYDYSDLDRYLVETVPLGLTTVNVGGNGGVCANRDVAFAKAVAAHLKEKGWWDLAYFYGWDEASQDLTDKLLANYGPLVEAVPDITIMQTGWSPSPKLGGYVKIWCPLTAGADMTAIRAAQAKGEEVWWYVCCGPTAPYANLFVDYRGLDHRILGWQSFRYGIQGFLYWGTDVWPKNGPPLGQYLDADYATWDPNSFATYNGDGYLCYPGPGEAPLASVRLELLRDGFEDYDLFTEIAARAGHGGPAAERARKLLRLGPPTITSLTQWTGDGAELLRVREQILAAGEALAR